MLSTRTFSLEGSIVSPDMTKRDTRLTGLFGLAGFQSSRARAELLEGVEEVDVVVPGGPEVSGPGRCRAARLRGRANLAGDVQRRGLQQLPVLVDAHLARLGGDEHAPVGREGQPHGPVERRDQPVLEAGPHGRRGGLRPHRQEHEEPQSVGPTPARTGGAKPRVKRHVSSPLALFETSVINHFLGVGNRMRRWLAKPSRRSA